MVLFIFRPRSKITLAEGDSDTNRSICSEENRLAPVCAKTVLADYA